ncbi:hypothetical protein OF83DRAFT_1171296 [Amylostereum chailletii]|nr:hypothetical protein OF83DRAFT_1171296 [Amylostereum chailletii]
MRWNDTPVIFRDLTALTKSLHLFAGLAIWEFLTNVLFDWRILIGKRKRRWTFWVYLLCRTSSVISACLVLRAIDATSNVGCEAILVPGLLFAVAAFLSSSFLVLMRLIAIWDRNRWILMVGSVIWLVNFPVVVYDYTVVRGSFDPLIRGCVVTHSAGTLTAYVTFLVTEISLLSLMFAGLLRPSMPRSSSIWQTLYVQGWAWLLLALVAEVPTLVLLCLNLNDAMNLVLQTPAMLTMSIGASRMYRSLSRSAREVYDTAK